MKIVNKILQANFGRDPERLAMKYRAMRNSPFVFLRGTCHLFYARLPKTGIFRSAPPVWSCGDLHIENFGSYKGDNRLTYFDINDFDEAALAPASWDLARLATSIFVGGHDCGLSKPLAHALAARLIDTYTTTLAGGRALWLERETSEGLVRTLLSQLRERTRSSFLDARTQRKGQRRHLRVDGRKMLPVTPEQRALVTGFMAQFARSQPHPAFYDVVDVARRIAGTGSLGVDRFAILVEGKGSPDQNYLLDLKQALPSSVATHLPLLQPDWQSQAQRVVAVQQRMQAVPMAFLHAVNFNGGSYILRALQPSEDRVAFTAQGNNPDRLLGLVGAMGQCVAAAQLRSAGRQQSAIADDLIAFALRRKWQAKLLDAADICAVQTRLDWAAYCKAYDKGAFAIPG